MKREPVEQGRGQLRGKAKLQKTARGRAGLAAALVLTFGCSPPPKTPATPEPAEPAVTPVADQPPAAQPGTPKPGEGTVTPTAGTSGASSPDPSASARETCASLCAQMESGCQGPDAQACRANCADHIKVAARCPVELDEALACQADAKDAVACQNAAAPSCAAAFNQLHACQTGKVAAKKKSAS